MKSKKKSEMLEVRLSHEDKQALQAKASNEGRTVSFVVRRLISDYLTQPEARSNPNRLMELLMTLKSKPKSFAALAAGCLLAPMGLGSFANAEEISISLETEYVVPTEENGVFGARVRRATTHVDVEIGKPATFEFPVASSDIRMVMTLNAKTDRISIDMTLCEVSHGFTFPREPVKIEFSNPCEGEKVLASPILWSLYGESAQFMIRIDENRSFSLSAAPNRP